MFGEGGLFATIPDEQQVVIMGRGKAVLRQAFRSSYSEVMERVPPSTQRFTTAKPTTRCWAIPTASTKKYNLDTVGRLMPHAVTNHVRTLTGMTRTALPKQQALFWSG